MSGRNFLAIVLCYWLAACSGGGSAGSSLPHTPVGVYPVTAPATGPAATQNVSVSILIPAPANLAAGQRASQYVSTRTQSAAIAIDGGKPTVANLTASSAGCVPSVQGLTCTVSVAASVGTHRFDETLYSGLNAGGSMLATGTIAATIAAGTANVVKLSLGGVAASVAIALTPSAPPQGTPATIPVTITVFDAGGAAIVGSDAFFNPIALTDSDTSGATKLSRTTLTGPADLAGVTLSYSGSALTSAVIGATAAGIAPKSISAATLAPAPSTLNDYATYGYDNARDGFNPNSKAFTPAAVGAIHLAWQTTVHAAAQLSGSQTMPVVATNVGSHAGIVIVGGVNGDFYGIDAFSGARIWNTPSLGDEQYTCSEGGSGVYHVGVGGTPVYDPGSKTFYVTANANVGPNATAQNTLYHFDALTGRQLGSVALTPNALPGEIDFARTALALGPGGLLYAGIGSTCDVSNTRGRVVAVNPGTMQIAGTFYTTWNQGGNYAGGGIWGWGGVSIDASGNVFTAAGNTWDARNAGQTLPPFVTAPSEQSAYGEHMLKLDPQLKVLDTNLPAFPIDPAVHADDLDFTGTPTLFQPVGCPILAAAGGKAGQLFFYDTTRIGGGTLAQYQLSQPYYFGAYLGNPTYSPMTGLLYANVASSRGGSIRPPGLIAIAPSGCGGFPIVWSAAYGPDSFAYPTPTSRGVPSVSAGGVVFASSPCSPDGSGGCGAVAGTAGGAVWAIDARSGLVLNAGKPLLTTPGQIRMPPVIDGTWLYIYDNNGDLYAFTVDPAIKAATLRRSPLVAPDRNVPHG